MIDQIREDWRRVVMDVLSSMAADKGAGEIPEITVGKPPKAEQGDLAFPMDRIST